MSDDAAQLSVGLLGPMYADFNNRPVTPRAAKQRQVLTLLALNAGRIVTIATLVEELWGDHPPRSYATTLQTYILQLRNALAAALPDDPEARLILSTRPCGYLLERDACRTDVEDFDRLVRAGRAAVESRNHRAAADQFGAALRLWRGSALIDVRLGRVLELEAASLEETRLGVLERRIAADLMLGRHADMLGELTLAVARNPMNENLSAFLMIALYRSGHVGRSLQVFHQIRSVLHEELGVEPCPRLQRLQMAILAADPALEAGSWSSSPLVEASLLDMRYTHHVAPGVSILQRAEADLWD
jgi:SARP family transcriptional regulator, regulator of embCAB operon